MKLSSVLLSLSVLAPLSIADIVGAEIETPAQRTVAEAYGTIDDQGRRVIRHAEVPEEDRNPWSAEREDAFITHYQQGARQV